MAEYSICKCIRTDKPVKRNGKYPIYLRVRVGFKDTKFPTNLDVWKEHWDIKKNEPKNKALLIQLNKKVLELDLYINRLLADGQELTLDLVRDYYSGKKKIKPENSSFYDYYLEFVERKRKEGLNPETIRVYMQKAFDKVLKKNGIYYSSKKGTWVKKKSKAKSIEEQTVKVEF